MMNEILEQLFETFTGQPVSETKELKSSGSNRRYYRISGPDGKTLVGVAGLDVNENNAFVSLARHFRSKGINVPEVLAVSADGMCYLQEDLGDVTLYDAISSGRESGEYAAAETELLKKWSFYYSFRYEKNILKVIDKGEGRPVLSLILEAPARR